MKISLAFGAIHGTAGDSSRLIGFCPGSGAMPWRRDGEALTQTQPQSPINDRGTEPHSNGCYDYCLACWLDVGGPSLPLPDYPA